jgi:hypothetical protein
MGGDKHQRQLLGDLQSPWATQKFDLLAECADKFATTARIRAKKTQFLSGTAPVSCHTPSSPRGSLPESHVHAHDSSARNRSLPATS